MKKQVMMAGLMFLLGGGVVLAEEAQPVNAATETPAVKKQTLCPVMTKNQVNKNLYVDADGKRIYVCCKGCIGAVKKDPAKYIKQLEAEGITLDKAEPSKAK